MNSKGELEGKGIVIRVEQQFNDQNSGSYFILSLLNYLYCLKKVHAEAIAVRRVRIHSDDLIYAGVIYRLSPDMDYSGSVLMPAKIASASNRSAGWVILIFRRSPSIILTFLPTASTREASSVAVIWFSTACS